MPDVPFLSDSPRALDQTLSTLADFDVSILAAHATATALSSVGLMDPISPPSTVYAAYNAYAGDRTMSIYPYADHDGGHQMHAVQLDWIADA